MAKKTKASSFSIEDRLEQALVPNWDYPYEIPQNWKFFWFTKLIDIEGGTQPPKSNFVEYELDGYIRLVQIRDFSSDKYIIYVPDSNKLRHFNENDILIARYGASLGIICTGLKGVYNVALAKTVFSEKVLNRKYVYWMLHSEAFQNPLMAISRTAQAGFNKEDLSRFAMPLPPLEEQERIVVCIESLFAKLDEAKDKAQEVIDSFETRKAAILHKAFSGELTAKWREKNDIPTNSWEKTKLGYLLREIKYGSSEKSDYSYTGIPILRIPNIGDMELIFDDLKFLCQNDCLPNEYLEEDDILIIRSNGSKDLVGKCAIVKDLDQKYTYASFLIRLRVLDGVYSPYIVWYLNSESARKQLFGKAKSSAGIHNINSKEIADIDIKIPRIPEQEKIVETLSALMEKEKQAKEIAEAVIEQIDTMKKAILARAFRGELGTNDPSEESAVELLKKVLGGDAAVQTPAKKPTKRILIPSDIKELLSNIREEEIIKLLLKSAPHPVSIQEIMSLSSKKFELMDALRSLEKKQLITKNESGDYSLTR